MEDSTQRDKQHARPYSVLMEFNVTTHNVLEATFILWKIKNLFVGMEVKNSSWDVLSTQ